MKYKRILLKLSGESLAGDGEYGLSAGVLGSYASQIREIAGAGVEVGIVIGGGNIFRGMQGAERGFDRVKGDQMGMLATVINSLALESALRAEGMQAKVLTSICMEPVGEYYSKDKAVDYLSRGYVVIIGGGTSNPYFTTDSAAALRGIEIEADVLLKGTRVDGIYDADPEKHPEARKFGEITFGEVYARGLRIMDLTAFTLCRENGLLLFVDGARLGAALPSKANDLTLPEFARLCDAFYIGGTKNGAMFGEALVITRPELTDGFFRMKKRMGAVMEKGWIQGVMFQALFTDDLYFHMARHANEMAARLQDGLRAKGWTLWVDSPTNQVFAVVDNALKPQLDAVCDYEDWCPYDGSHTVVRFVTCFQTSQEDVDGLLAALPDLH